LADACNFLKCLFNRIFLAIKMHYKSAATSVDPGNKMPKVNFKKEYFVSI
jgi:hypothetical protein